MRMTVGDFLRNREDNRVPVDVDGRVLLHPNPNFLRRPNPRSFIEPKDELVGDDGGYPEEFMVDRYRRRETDIYECPTGELDVIWTFLRNRVNEMELRIDGRLSGVAWRMGRDGRHRYVWQTMVSLPDMAGESPTLHDAKDEMTSIILDRFDIGGRTPTLRELH